MKKGNYRRLFPGNNTPIGFFSYYQYILPNPNHIYCIKGGPGVGKSTFMKRIGKDMINSGFDVEYMHCSSDPDSLDGLVIPKLSTAFIDGTAPHIVDPKYPGGVDEIINLGDYWDNAAMKLHKNDIIDTTNEIGRLFNKAYNYLTASGCIKTELDSMYSKSVYSGKINLKACQIVEDEFEDYPLSAESGFIRRLFATAITPDGLLSHLDTVLSECSRVYSIVGNAGMGASQIIKKAAQAAVDRGFDIEIFYCPMKPSETIEHVIIPKLKLAFISANRYHPAPLECSDVLDLNEFIIPKSYAKLKADIKSDTDIFDNLLDKGINTIKKAKTLHDHLETHYIPNMDFDALEEKRQEIMKRLLD